MIVESWPINVVYDRTERSIVLNEILFIWGYAPNEILSNKHPEQRYKFYADLKNALSKKKANTIAIIALDVNARTSYSNDGTLPNLIGKHTRGISHILNPKNMQTLIEG